MARLVLVIDDTPVIREEIAERLEQEGYATEGAADGQDALNKLEQGPLPDVILLDLMMPRMNGLEFRERQLADPRLAEIPVVLMTAHRTIDAKGLRLKNLLLKPFGTEQLLEAIRAVEKVCAPHRESARTSRLSREDTGGSGPFSDGGGCG